MHIQKLRKQNGKAYIINVCNNLCFPAPILKEKLDSTSTYLRRLAEDGAPHGTIVIAKKQSSGRGRTGKSFLSPEGGLYMSVLLKCDFNSMPMDIITPTAAVAVAISIKDVLNLDVSVKWVNDLFYKDRKVCGILTEVIRDPSDGHIKYIILGIGVNVFEPHGGFGELSGIAGSLNSGCIDISVIHRLASRIIENYFILWTNDKRKLIYDEYKKRLFILGNSVFVIRGNEKQNVIVRELENDFTLTVEYGNGSRENLSSGEISIIPYVNS